MNAQMYAVPGTTYMPASLDCPSANVAKVTIFKPPLRRVTPGRSGLSTAAVMDLLEAAGPLSVSDIAGGLGASVREAQAVVWRMVDEDRVRPDEWDRMILRRRSSTESSCGGRAWACRPGRGLARTLQRHDD